MEYNIRFDGPPGPSAGRFVEVENEKGFSINAGEWIGPDDDGSWILRIRPECELQQRLATVEAELEEIKSRYAEDMKYIGGIVEKGTGNKLIGNIPIRLQLLGYVKSVEIVNLRRCHTEAKLLEVIKLFYRKHVLNDESIGWDELGNNLYNELAETLGDKEFCKWLDTQSMSK